MKTYTVTYQSQGENLSQAKKNLRGCFEFGYGRGELQEELIEGLQEETVDSIMGGVPLNRLAQYLYESEGGKFWADPQTVSQKKRSHYFKLARQILTVGAPHLEPLVSK